MQVLCLKCDRSAHMSRSSRILVLLVCTVFSGTSVQAIERAPASVMAQSAKDAEGLWTSPASNCEKICSALIRPGVIDRDALLTRIHSMLNGDASALDRAALHYLSAETYYWGALSKLQATGDRAWIKTAETNVVVSLLTAWETVTNSAPTSQEAELRGRIVRRFNQMLATSVCGGNLPSNLQGEVVSKYIDQLTPRELTVSWPNAQRGKAYANLGIQARLVAGDVLTATNYFEVCRSLELAQAARCTNEAVLLAHQLERCYQRELAQDLRMSRTVCEVYRVADDMRALPFLKELTSRDPTAWLDMYDYDIEHNPATNAADRVAWIANYTTSVSRVQGNQMEAYRLAIERLVRHGDNALATRLAEDVLSDKTVYGRGTQAEALLLRIKGVAHVGLGEKNKAEAAYRACMKLESQIQGEDVRVLIRKELAALMKVGSAKEGGL